MYKALDKSIRDSEKLAELSDFSYRVWAQGLAASDMVGRISGNPKKFWAEAMPLVPFDQAKYASAIKELSDSKLIHVYEADGKPYIVFHEHEEYNKGQKNLKYQHPSKLPPPPPSLCYCVVYTKKEEGGCNGRYKDPVTADLTAVPTAGVLVPSPVLVPVHVPDRDGGVEEGEEWPPMPATARGHLWKLFRQAKITGTPSQLRQYFEAWLAQAGAQRLEQILMEPKVKGVDVFAVQRWFFNDILANSRRNGA